MGVSSLTRALPETRTTGMRANGSTFHLLHKVFRVTPIYKQGEKSFVLSSLLIYHNSGMVHIRLSVSSGMRTEDDGKKTSTLEMEAAFSSETSVEFQLTTRCYRAGRPGFNSRQYKNFLLFTMSIDTLELTQLPF
jgi:hypothetical protein